MKPVDYFSTHPLFRFEDFATAHREGDARKPAASQAVLRQHLRAGHLLHVRRGLYAVVPRGTLAETLQIDPFLLASRLAPDAVTDYALKLGSAVTVAKVGFFLEQHREELMLEESHLERLQEHAPSQPRYLERGKREPGRLLTRWNLVVPERVLNRTWAEVT